MEYDPNLDLSSEEILEGIGKDVLMSYENGNIPSFLDITTDDPTKALLDFLSTPKNKLKPGWEIEFSKVLDKLTQIEYAIYGKQIAYFLLAICKDKQQKAKKQKHKSYYDENTQEQVPKFTVKHNYYQQPKSHVPKRKFPEWLPTV